MAELRRLNFAPGDRLLISGREYTFTGEIAREGASLDEARDLGLKEVRTAAPLSLALESFDQLYARGEVRLLKPYERRNDQPPELEGAESEPARWRRLWCEAFDAAPCSRSDAGLRALIARVGAELGGDRPPPSPGALRVWLRERGSVGDRRARFMGDRRGQAPSPLRLDPSVQHVLAEQAEVFYDGVRINPQAVYFAVRSAIVELNVSRAADGLPPLRAPGESTVRRYLRRHMDYGRALRRYGWREGGRHFKPILGSMQAKHILDVAIIDQTLIDCTVIDDEHMINVGRPWLAVMIDVRSRYPLGFCLSFEPPSVETVLACIRHGVRPKGELESPGQVASQLASHWIGFGVPDTIVVDNAWENTGSSFRDACADANISIVFAPVATPEYKGVVERFFGTLNSLLFHRLPGGLPFTPQQRSKLGLDNDKDAALLLSDVRHLIHQCIVEVFGRSFHKALQACPEQVWRKDAASHGRPYVDDLAALDLALAKLVPGERTLSRAGITHNELTYRAPEPLAELLADLLHQQAPRRGRGGTAKVKVKYHPEDLGQVYVWNEVRRRYVTLPCTQPLYAQRLSEHHHQLIRENARAEHLAFQSEDERCAARVRLQQQVLPSIPLAKVRARQNAQRLLGQAPLAPLAGPLPAPEHAIALAPLTSRSDAGAAHRAPGRKAKPRRAAVQQSLATTPSAPMPSAFAAEFPPAGGRGFAEFFDEKGAVSA